MAAKSQCMGNEDLAQAHVAQIVDFGLDGSHARVHLIGRRPVIGHNLHAQTCALQHFVLIENESLAQARENRIDKDNCALHCCITSISLLRRRRYNFRLRRKIVSGLLGTVVAWVCLALSAVPLLYLLIVTFAALAPRRAAPSATARKIAVLIPAHNEALLIADTVADLFRQDYPSDRFVVLVIADNCTDATAALARAQGARVVERQANPGKGQALHEALTLLLEEDWGAFLVVDADSRLHRQTLAALDRELAHGAKAIQIRYGVLNPTDSLRTRAMELSTASFNALRPRGRCALGLSAGITGNGFCLSRAVVQQVPYLAHSIVEDIEYHLLLLRAGVRVRFLDQVWVKAQMPVGARAAQAQRVRWERGRISTIRNYAPGLWRDWLRGHRQAFDGLIDVLMPPVSLIFIALLPALLLGTRTQIGIAVAGLLILCVHYVVAAWRYGSLASLVLVCLYVPWYVAWKTYVVIGSLVTQRRLAWVRTDRDKSPPSNNS
jgi:cellulose synthase/poly-beta-1,6-N-acetylglucosamine synthase-like glycosyltransferase